MAATTSAPGTASDDALPRQRSAQDHPPQGPFGPRGPDGHGPNGHGPDGRGPWATSGDAVVHLSGGQLAPILTSLMLGMLLAALDQTVVGTAMPRVIADLGGQNISWVYTAYLLASTVAVPIYGKLSDIYGRRVFFLGGMVVFLLGSALSGTSQNMTQLILYRALQGLGGGALMPIAQSIIGDIFTPAERGRWQGLFTAVFGMATIFGPILGGWITDSWGWRWTFYVNMPVGVLALVVAALALPKASKRRHHSIDYWGAITLTLWSVPLLLGFSFGGTQYPWGSWQIIGLFVIAVVMLAAFILVEFRAPEPILSPRLFENSTFTISTIAMVLLSAGMFGAILYLPYFVQDVLLESATNSGIVLMPMMLGFMVTSIVSGQLLAATGRYKLMALFEFALGALGMYLFAQMTASTSHATLIRNMVITGLGIGGVMSLFTIVVQNAFPLRKIGEVTASLSFFRSMGGTIGLAVFGSILTNSFTGELQARIPPQLKPYLASGNFSIGGAESNLPALEAKLTALGPQGHQLFVELLHAIEASFAVALDHVFFIGAIALALAFVATLFLKEIPLRQSVRPDMGEEALHDPELDGQAIQAARHESAPLAADVML